jgi:probable F420-dependent oxidoreductase
MKPRGRQRPAEVAVDTGGSMRFGLHALGIGIGARPQMIRAVSAAAEQAGFARLWSGEHVVMVDRPASRYPYSNDGQIAVPADADWLDPMLGLTFAAAATSRIGLATGILLLPEHNPVLVAKQAATLDVLSEGRLTLGIGIGWSAEEFAALGVPFARRGQRTAEYVAAIRTLWSDDRASFSGEFTHFEAVRVYPKPAANRHIPVVVGGNSDAALQRVAAFGDGWYGFNLSADAAVERVGALSRYCQERGRALSDLTVAAALSDGSPDMVPSLGRVGISELVLVAAPPEPASAAAAWVGELAAEWRVRPISEEP